MPSVFVEIESTDTTHGSSTGTERSNTADMKNENMDLTYGLSKVAERSNVVRIWLDGAFDMMHYGHMNAFRQGRALGDIAVN
jgi:bifunctional ADP-heptose synthase (sugar kinase/adenylyltransferase)